MKVIVSVAVSLSAHVYKLSPSCPTREIDLLSKASCSWPGNSTGMAIAPPRAEAPEMTSWPDFLETNAGGPGLERPWDRGFREFPFLSTCLLLGTGYTPSTSALYQVHTAPLGTQYRDNSLDYGMVVVDISELERIRYGIVGFMVNQMAEVGNCERWYNPGDYDPVEDSPPEDDPVPTVEEYRPRLPLSAEGYMNKFRYYSAEGDLRATEQNIVRKLEQKQLVDVLALHCTFDKGSTRHITLRICSNRSYV